MLAFWSFLDDDDDDDNTKRFFFSSSTPLLAVKMKVSVISLLLLATTNVALGYTLNRRALLRDVTAAVAAVQVAPPAQAVLSSKYCASGMGEGCGDLAEGNEFIRALQEKSAANRERNEKVRCRRVAMIFARLDKPSHSDSDYF